jgi:hypothetical protein
MSNFKIKGGQKARAVYIPVYTGEDDEQLEAWFQSFQDKLLAELGRRKDSANISLDVRFNRKNNKPILIFQHNKMVIERLSLKQNILALAGEGDWVIFSSLFEFGIGVLRGAAFFQHFEVVSD